MDFSRVRVSWDARPFRVRGGGGPGGVGPTMLYMIR